MIGKRGSKSSSMYMMFQRKAQVTVFIIVGILVLFIFAGILFVTRSTTTEKFTAEGEPVIADVPQQFKPIQQYTENCLRSVARQGLLLLGQQGGYLYPDLLGEYSVTHPTNAVGVNIDPTKVPYWHYNAEPDASNKIAFSSLQPKLTTGEDPQMSVEAQLQRYVQEQIGQCLQAYEPFTTQGFTFSAIEVPEAEVQVRDEKVNFLLRMPFEVRKGDASSSLDLFFVKIPLNLKHYYDVAATIAQQEQEHQFLERQGLEVLSIYSKKDVDYFPPISDVTYDLFSPYSWSEATLQEKLKELLSSYVPMLRFLGSSNFYYFTYPQGNPLAQKVVDNTVLPLTAADDLDIAFDYLGWEPYFKTNSENGIIKPESIFVNYEFLTFGTQRYETHYDFSYPVLVTIADDAALDGEGYNFVIALEANVRNNQPAVGGEKVAPYPRKITPLACNPEQQNSALLKTVVVDSFTKEPLDVVKVGFTIPEQTECEMGITDTSGTVESKYPLAYGGVINFVKLDYLTDFYPIDTYKNKDQSALLGYAVAGAPAEKVIELDHIVTKNVRIQKKELKKCITPLVCEYTVSGPIPLPAGGAPLSILPYHDIDCDLGERQCFLNNNGAVLGDPVLHIVANGSYSQVHDYYFLNKGKQLADDEEATLTLERVSGFHDEVLSAPFTTVISTHGDLPVDVRLVPGKYKVSGIVTKKAQLEIPAEQRCFKYSILGYDNQECFTLEQSSLDSYIIGNLQWQVPETYLTITPEDLYSAQEITFSVLTQDLASVPVEINGEAKKCGGFACFPAVGCLFSACTSEDLPIPGRVVEDLQVPGKMVELTAEAVMRKALEPTYK